MFTDNNGNKYYTHDDISILDQKIDSLIIEYANKFGLDINDYNFRVSIRHNEVTNIFRYIAKYCFRKPYNTNLINGQHALLIYTDDKLIIYLANKFLDICNYFNKSLGLYEFSVFTEIDYIYLQECISEEGEKVNPARAENLKKLVEYNRRALLSNLKESAVGQIAIANNDVDTGLQWTKNQQAIEKKETVYFLPSERLDRLRISDNGQNE